MADATEFLETTWGRIRLFCARIETDNSRTQVVHQPAVGDVSQVQDRGLATRRARCALLFDDFPGESKSPLERFLLFKGQVDTKGEEVFTHPIDGAFLAKVADFRYVIDEDGNLSDCSCEFINTDEVIAVHPAAPGTTGATAIDGVTAAAQAASAELAAVGIETDLPDRATAAVDGWTSGETVPTRDVMNETAALTSEAAALTEQLEDDLALWAAWVAMVKFTNSIRDAALAATSETSSIFVLRVAVATSLLALVTRVYGGADAEDRERQVRSLNDLRTPSGLVQAGTDLVMPAVEARRAA